ncbi:MAG: hypothetical protein NTW55_05640 [Planctomycetota bacterium]|nr:hypothetical protein [Planctomycetota bacterium]
MRQAVSISIVMLFLAGAGCSTAPEEQEGKDVLASESQEAIALFKAKDPTIEKFFQKSYGYAIVPKIFKGGFIVGGAYGHGQVYEKDIMVGYCNMTQGTLGLSFGGEFYREIIFFKDKYDLDAFKSDEYTFAAQVTAIAAYAGVAAKADYKDGMAVFIMAEVGLMVDAAAGGQKFNYVPK